jgi:transposase
MTEQESMTEQERKTEMRGRAQDRDASITAFQHIQRCEQVALPPFRLLHSYSSSSSLEEDE